MEKFYYIVEEVLEFDYESSLSIPRFVTNGPEVAFEWIKNNPIVYNPQYYGDYYYRYIVRVSEVCPSYIIKHHKELL